MQGREDHFVTSLPLKTAHTRQIQVCVLWYLYITQPLHPDFFTKEPSEPALTDYWLSLLLI